jgi:hypothetical protein
MMNMGRMMPPLMKADGPCTLKIHAIRFAAQKGMRGIFGQGADGRFNSGANMRLYSLQHRVDSLEKIPPRLGAAARRLFQGMVARHVQSAQMIWQRTKAANICRIQSLRQIKRDHKLIIIRKPSLARIIAKSPNKREPRPSRLIKRVKLRRGQRRGFRLRQVSIRDQQWNQMKMAANILRLNLHNTPKLRNGKGCIALISKAQS